MKKNIHILINDHKNEFNDYYKDLLKSLLPNNELSKAMLYGAFNGGKRIRPFLVESKKIFSAGILTPSNRVELVITNSRLLLSLKIFST